MWCVKWWWVVSWLVGVWRVWLRVMACRVRMRWWAWAGTAWPKAFCLGCVCAGSRPERRGRSAVRRRRRGAMACLSLLLPAWETCSPLMEEPDLLVTGARPAYEASWAPVTGGPCPGSGPARTAAAGTPDPGHVWSEPGT